MRKLLLTAIALLGFAVTASAQDSGKKVTTKTTTKEKKSGDVTKSETKTEKDVVLKKDGTPDKRYKSTKTVKHMKKDGTPDMRYKENKEAAKK